MKPFSLRIFNYKFWVRAALFFCAVFVVHALVKTVTLYIASGLGIINIGRDFWFQLFSLQMIPAIIAYGILAGIAYAQFVKVGRIMNRIHTKDMEMERGKATVETMQKVTAYMAEYISHYNNEILTWVSKKKQKGEDVPQAVALSSNRIAEAMGSLSEISFILPYDKSDTDPARYIDILKNRLESYPSAEKLVV